MLHILIRKKACIFARLESDSSSQLDDVILRFGRNYAEHRQRNGKMMLKETSILLCKDAFMCCSCCFSDVTVFLILWFVNSFEYAGLKLVIAIR